MYFMYRFIPRSVNPIIAILLCGVILAGAVACLAHFPELVPEHTVLSLSHRTSAAHFFEQVACLVAVLAAVGSFTVWLSFIMQPTPLWWQPATLVFPPFKPPRPPVQAVTVA